MYRSEYEEFNARRNGRLRGDDPVVIARRELEDEEYIAQVLRAKERIRARIHKRLVIRSYFTNLWNALKGVSK